MANLGYSPDWSKVSKCSGYPAVFCPEHHRAWSTGYVHVHIIVAEEMIGRLLGPKEVVHHKDRNKSNNDPENLTVFASNAEHRAEHANDRPETILELTCENCKIKFNRRLGQEAEKKGQKFNFCTRRCGGIYGAANRIDKTGTMLKQREIVHGTSNAYSHRKCRCDTCRKAHRERIKEYNSKKRKRS